MGSGTRKRRYCCCLNAGAIHAVNIAKNTLKFTVILPRDCYDLMKQARVSQIAPPALRTGSSQAVKVASEPAPQVVPVFTKVAAEIASPQAPGSRRLTKTDPMKALRLLIICASLVLSACSQPTLNRLSGTATLLAFGDSLTAGKGSSTESSYPAVLAELSGLTVVNAGVSGETTAEGLRRLPQVLDDNNPDLLLLMHGGNDILQNLGARQAKANLTAMIKLARDRGIQVVLIGVPEKKLLSSSAPYYEELAEEFDLVLETSIISKLLKKPALKSDAVHFNAAGYREIASTIFELLKDRGAL